MYRKIFQEAIDAWGTTPQLDMAIEEMSELTKEICKYKRGKENIANIAEEMADVYIMLEQLKLIFNCEDKIKSYKGFKILRLRKLLNDHYDCI